MALKSVVRSSTPQPTVSRKPEAYKGIMTISLSSTAQPQNTVLLPLPLVNASDTCETCSVAHT